MILLIFEINIYLLQCLYRFSFSFPSFFSYPCQALVNPQSSIRYRSQRYICDAYAPFVSHSHAPCVMRPSKIQLCCARHRDITWKRKHITLRQSRIVPEYLLLTLKYLCLSYLGFPTRVKQVATEQ